MINLAGTNLPADGSKHIKQRSFLAKTLTLNREAKLNIITGVELCRSSTYCHVTVSQNTNNTSREKGNEKKFRRETIETRNKKQMSSTCLIYRFRCGSSANNANY